MIALFPDRSHAFFVGRGSGRLCGGGRATTYALKLVDVVVGEQVGVLQVLLRVQGLAHQTLPEGGQQVQGEGHVGPNGHAQQLAQEVEQLLLGVADGGGGQDVLPLGGRDGKKSHSMR